MSIHKSGKAKPAPADTQPTIAALPPPDLIMVLTEERDRLSLIVSERDYQLADSRGKVEKLIARLAELERNPLVYAMTSLDAGSELEQAGKDFKELASKCSKMGEKGSLTLKLALKPFKGDSFTYGMEWTVKAPKPEATPGILYVDNDGNVSRQDPKQREMNFAGSNSDRAAPGDASPYADEQAAAD